MLKRVATFLLGVALIGLGVFFFRASEQAYAVQMLKTFWPLFLVLAGLVRLAGYAIDRHPRSPVGSLLLTTLGGSLLAINLRGETSLTAIIGRYWFWFLLAFVMGRVLRQYTATAPLSKQARALSPGAIFVMLLIAGTGLSANYVSRNNQLLARVNERISAIGGVGEYVLGNPIRVDDEAPQPFKLPANARLLFNTFNGDIEIRGAATAQATAKLIKHIRASSEEKARDIARQIHLQIAANASTVQFVLNAERVKETYSTSLLIELPTQQTANIEINEASGAVKLADLRGEQLLRNCGSVSSARNRGALTVEDPRGRVEVAQHEGDLTLNNLRAGASLSEIKGKLVLRAEGGAYQIKQLTGAVRASIANSRLELREVQAPVGFPAAENLVTLDELSNTRASVSNLTGNLLVKANHSRVEAEGVNGDVQIATTNESIKLTRCNGAVHVTAENGAVTAVDLKGAIQIEATRDIAVQNFAGSLSVKSRNGKITLTHNDELAGDLTASNENGQTRLSLPRDILFRLDASTTSGRLRARGFEWLALERNQKSVNANPPTAGAAPLVSLRSASGDIELQAAGLALASNEE
ncbi:MAG: DUF4097 family beta strand repeat protein [Acidobacteria bacterium]|nr:DUF4097 family beta strand repeat protein [Acidobacteriota bacterium]